MFNPSDIYVSGGPDDLMVCWTANVTKFDASSVYNWEHDNLPLLDLEDRTHLLWERLGHPTSALTGMSFVVSADATSSCYPTYFTTLSSCIAALPEVINCPILIEVASFGDLGSLHLSNKRTGPNGSLEIVNRQAAFNSGKELAGDTINIQQNHSNTSYGFFASSFSSDGPGYEVDARSVGVGLGAAFGLVPNNYCDHTQASIYSTGQFIASGNLHTDTRFTSNGITAFTRNVGPKNNRMTAAIKSTGTGIPWSTSLDASAPNEYKLINFNPFDLNDTYRLDEGVDTYDVSTINEITNAEILWGVNTPSATTGVGNTYYEATCNSYTNTLTSLKIENCHGNIYIRNFVVDGGDSHTLENGIEILNSNIVLDRCAATRCSKAGLKAVNSEVLINRGFVAYRIYGFDYLGNRIGLPYADKLNNKEYHQSSYGAGIRAINSDIVVSNTFNRDYLKLVESLEFPEAASWDLYLFTASGTIPTPNSGNLFCISRCEIGIDAVESSIFGGRTELPDIVDSAYSSTPGREYLDSSKIFIELNNECGIKLKNSSVDLSGRLFLYGNYRGLEAINSDILVDTLKAQYNQKEAILLTNSNFIYGKDGYTGKLHATELGYSTARSTFDLDQITLEANGRHIVANNSVIKPLMTSSMPAIHQGFFVSGSIGAEFGRYSTKVYPAIELNNSYADLLHPTILRDTDISANDPSYGGAVLANNGSTLYLRGSSTYATRILGPTSKSVQNRKAAIAALNNSTIHIQGPTAIARFAVDILADSSSKIEIEPHRNTDGTLLVEEFDLDDPLNHTKVELHSTRSCLVVDHGSELNMEDVGSYHPFWSIGTYGGGLDSSRYDYLNDDTPTSGTYVSYVSGGYVQFYANAMDSSVDGNPPGIPAITIPAFSSDTNHPAGLSTSSTQVSYLFTFTDAAPDGISAVTTGGMCVRALNGSKVDVNNVHFPAGWSNTSSIYYDYGGSLGPCSRIHIWNIADTSQLNARYVTVSGVHPRDAGYYGPSGTWGASSAPSSTPDTSSLSVLDYYGKDGDSANPYGKSSFENFGAFRLYFSTDPVANFLVDPVTIVSGVPYQIFSQGYNFSGSLSAPGGVSALYTSVLKRGTNGVISPSAFYYASSMLHSPTTVKVVLDDSASNTFANAKHNSVGKSGLGKIVHIYDPFYIGFGGDSTTSKATGTGIGSVNNFDLGKDN